ncbi:hypothetical protein C8R45DRAFT_1143154 [Mycena sanguinolenta]|nr:hypothetical protein C8R45DRAFT_1143154 [Mycena sanguinolenta]
MAYAPYRGRAVDIAAIFFAHSSKGSECTGFPFKTDTEFLGLKGRRLFQKLVVVRPSPDEVLKQAWSDLLDSGMRVVDDFDGQLERAGSLLFQLFPELGFIGHGPGQLYDDGARETGRHARQAVVLLVGHSGHGKSTTINRLIGQNLLEVGRSASGSTTKAIQRVEVRNTSSHTGVAVSLAFDDTPGGGDTVHADGVFNSGLMDLYKTRYFPDLEQRTTYPNVVLLVASWDSITEDAHNHPNHFTSAAGKSMQSLSLSGLVDPTRSNVVVVITKSMSSWDQFDDIPGLEAQRDEWIVEAEIRKGIIIDLQRKVFPRLTPWEVVFVENGVENDMRAPYPVLPNRELSHQNLFDAICRLILQPGPHGKDDFAGMHALDVLTGAKRLNEAQSKILVSRQDVESAYSGSPHGDRHIRPPENLFDPRQPGPHGKDGFAGMHALEVLTGTERLDEAQQIQSKILVSRQEPDVEIGYTGSPHGDRHIRPPDAHSQPPTRRELELANLYLGVTYNPLTGVFGRKRILLLDASEIMFSGGPDRQAETFRKEVADDRAKKGIATQLQWDFSIPDIVSLDANYTSSSAIQSASTEDSMLYAANHVTGLISAEVLEAQLSPEMLDIISRLPPWSEQSKQSKARYHEFFSQHGTHVVLRLALGGNLRVVIRGGKNNKGRDKTRRFGAKAAAPVGGIGLQAGGNMGRSSNREAEKAQDSVHVQVFREGGGSLSGELTRELETYVKGPHCHLGSDSFAWPSAEVREQWITALKVDPAFCSDSEETQYTGIYSLGGLTYAQQEYLREASKSYLKMRYKKHPDIPANGPRSGKKNLPRQGNHQSVVKWFKRVFALGRRGEEQITATSVQHGGGIVKS